MTVLAFPAQASTEPSNDSGDREGFYEQRVDGQLIGYFALDAAGRMTAFRAVLPGDNPDLVCDWVIDENTRVRRGSMRIAS